MDQIENDLKTNKIKDIEAIVFAENVQEILTTMEIVLTIYQIDDDFDIVKTCKSKLLEGLHMLRKLGVVDKVNFFDENMRKNADENEHLIS